MSAPGAARDGESTEVRQRIADVLDHAYPAASDWLDVADAVLDALTPDDLDRLVGAEAKDAEAVYLFAKAAVRAETERLRKALMDIHDLADRCPRVSWGWAIGTVAAMARDALAEAPTSGSTAEPS